MIVLGIGVVVWVYAYAVLVGLVCITWIASLTFATKLLGQVESEHCLLYDVMCRVPSYVVYV